MILILGATGYLGQAFAAELRRRKLEFTPLTRKAVDYTRFDVLFNYVHHAKPDFIINAAGYPGVPDIDACENDRAEALKANTLLPQTMARVCYLTKTPWGHVSSGCIFSGARVGHNGSLQAERDLNRPEIRRLFDMQPEKFRGYSEADEPNCTFRSPPCSFYSGTKALAEESLHWSDQGYLWRPRILFDEFDHPRNYLSKIQTSPKLFDDVNSFTHRGDFVHSCIELWKRRAPFGIYNIVNPGAATTRQIIAAVERILKPKRAFEFWETEAAAQGAAADTPRASCILDAGKLVSVGVNIRPLRQALEDSLKNWQPTPQDDDWLTNDARESDGKKI